MKKNRITVFTENPEEELWKKLLQYAYKARVLKYYSDNSIHIEGKEAILSEIVIGSFLQAHEYYYLSKTATLHTSPLLLYYGTINLLLGACTLFFGEELAIKNHGMKIKPSDTSTDIGSSKVCFVSKHDGGIHVFKQIIEAQTQVSPDLEELSIKEMLLSIPEINFEAIQCYGEEENYCIPLDTIYTEDGVIEKAYFRGKNRDTILHIFSCVPDFNRSYLNPSFSENEDETIATLRHKYLQEPIDYTAMTGQSYLLVGHNINRGKSIVFPQWIYMYAALYGMASLCRYSPQKWNPFIRLDEKGEKLLVEKFIDLSRRKLPNIILSMIEKCDYSFENKKYEPDNKIKVIDRHEIKSIIQEELSRKEARR